jgi:hypothetical protein
MRNFSIPTEQIERAHQSDVLSVARRLGAILRPVGNEHVGGCPVCGNSGPRSDRFSVNTTKQVWNCRVCNVGGDVITLVEHVTGRDFHGAIETLTGEDFPQATNKAKQTNGDDKEARRLRNARFCWHKHQPPEGTIVETYLRSRGYGGAIPSTIGLLLGVWVAGNAGLLPKLADTVPDHIEAVTEGIEDGLSALATGTAGKHPPAMVAAFGMPLELESGTLAVPQAAIHPRCASHKLEG